MDHSVSLMMKRYIFYTRNSALGCFETYHVSFPLIVEVMTSFKERLIRRMLHVPRSNNDLRPWTGMTSELQAG